MRVIAAVLLAVLCFTWGFLTHRHRTFPHSLLTRAARSAGLVREDGPRHKMATSRSPALGALTSLPYVGGTGEPAAGATGVVHLAPELVSPGLSLVVTGQEPAARLLQPDGTVAHEWRHGDLIWQDALLLADGDLLVLVKDHALIRLDAASDPRWAHEARVHHSVSADAEGNLHVLVREARLVPDIHPRLPVLDELVVTLDAQGRHLRSFSVLDVLMSSPHAYLLPSLQGQVPVDDAPFELDVLHANTVRVLDGRHRAASPLFTRGNVLLSLRNICTVLVVEAETHEILWLWGPTNVTFQHDPSVLPDGRLLLFDNGATRSRLLEIEPDSRRIAWSYSAGDSFFSRTRGACQRLPNGNTLVTESDRGRAFEMTPDRRMAWAYVNPRVTPEGEREVLRRVTRLPPGAPAFLSGH